MESLTFWPSSDPPADDPAVRRAALAILAEEAQHHLRNCYGEASMKNAERFARAALEAAKDPCAAA